MKVTFHDLLKTIHILAGSNSPPLVANSCHLLYGDIIVDVTAYPRASLKSNPPEKLRKSVFSSASASRSGVQCSLRILRAGQQDLSREWLALSSQLKGVGEGLPKACGGGLVLTKEACQCFQGKGVLIQMKEGNADVQESFL